MAKFRVVNTIRLGTLMVYAGTLVDDAQENTAAMLAAGARLYPSANSFIAAAGSICDGLRAAGSFEACEGIMTMAAEAADGAQRTGGQGVYIRTTNGAQILMPKAPVARKVLIHTRGVVVFANGDGTQPTFSVGETGTAAKFAATAKFTNLAAGTEGILGGILSADADLLVTAVAATGTTSTGEITMTAMTAP